MAEIETGRGVSPVRDQAPTIVSVEGDSSEERGSFKA